MALRDPGMLEFARLVDTEESATEFWSEFYCLFLISNVLSKNKIFQKIDIFVVYLGKMSRTTKWMSNS